MFIIFLCPSDPLFLSLSATYFQHEPYILLSKCHWHKQVREEKTSIAPVQCKSLWRQFKAETENTVTQAIAAQEANKRNNNSLPPPWALAALAILGFNEFMTLLKNPLYLGVIFVVFLVGKAIWVQLDIAKEFQNGFLPTVLSLSTKFVPTIMNSNQNPQGMVHTAT